MSNFSYKIYNVAFFGINNEDFIDNAKDFFGDSFEEKGIILENNGTVSSILKFEKGISQSILNDFKEYIKEYSFDKKSNRYVSNFVDFDNLHFE